VPYAQRLEGYLDTILENPARARLLLWQALDDQPDDENDTDTESVLEDIRRRQRDGELTSEYDAEFIIIVSWAAMMTPVALPQLVRGSYGADPAAFREAFLPQLQRLFRNAGPSSEPEA
jgi:hypothetical protein